jgi:hypothetical protein
VLKDNEQFLSKDIRSENGQSSFGYKCEVILSPDKTLSGEEKLKLSHRLTSITAKGFMRDISSKTAYEALFQDVFNHVVPCDRLNIYRKRFDGDPIAFISSGLKEFEGNRLYHLEGIIVVPELHGNGFAYEILKKELVACNAEMLAFHTQSRLMKGLGNRVSIFNVDLARSVAVLIGTTNLIDTLEGPIDRGRYGGSCLYGDIERFDPVAIKQPDFDYLNGDAIVFAGRIEK